MSIDYKLTTSSTRPTFDTLGRLVLLIAVTSLDPAYPFAGAVTLSATGLPAGTTYSIAPASVVPGAAGSTSNLTIQLPTGYAFLSHPPLGPRQSRAMPELAGLAGALLLLFRKRRRAVLPQLAAVLLMLAALTSLSGCGTGAYELPGKMGTVTILGISGSSIHDLAVTVYTQ